MAMRRLEPSLALALAAGLAGGCAYTNTKNDIDRQPIVHHGVGATILMPGQSAPALPVPVRGVGQRGAPAPVYGGVPGGGGSTSGSYSGSGTGTGSGGGYAAGPGTAQGYGGGSYGSPAPGAPPVGSGGNIQFIGGAEIDEVTHTELHQDPLLLKGLFAPVALVAWPFRKAYEALQGDPEPVVAPPPDAPAPRGPMDYEAAYEQSQLDQLEQQVAQPAPGASAQLASRPPAPSAAGAGAGARPSSIADELAALQRRVPPRGVLPEAGAPPKAGAPTPSGVADKVSDRNGDGRPDVWQYRDNGVLVRELFDEDGDGRVDRTIRYDTATGQKSYEEEDSNVDGLVDSWVEYRGGEVIRRRQDGNGDGQPDSWTLYRAGKLARVEEDRNGDGFRDRVGYYQDGRMRREVEDANGDGRPDRVTLYDDSERARERSEDVDGDGLVDARSFFENGKLVRRELVDESVSAQPLVEEEQLGTPEGFSDGSEGASAPEPPPGDEG
jgi:hypothetical protein